jgi:hypothetical protein
LGSVSKIIYEIKEQVTGSDVDALTAQGVTPKP